jgi:hypothetical protein
LTTADADSAPAEETTAALSHIHAPLPPDAGGDATMVSHPKVGTGTGMVQIRHPLREWVEKTKPVLDPVEMAKPVLDPAESTVLGAMIAARAPKANSLTVLIVVD